MLRSVVSNLYENFEKYFCAFIMSIMVICLGAQVFFRFVLDAALTWSEEMSRFAFVWVIYLGASMAAMERSHIRVTVPQLLLPSQYRHYATMFADFIWLVFNLFFAYQGVLQVKHMLAYTFISPAMRWNTAFVYMIIPIGFFFMSFRIVQGYWRDYKKGGIQAMGVDLFSSERSIGEEAKK
ncbi:MAG: TRAP transporter small permease [Deltaproteobacteria bacterium]|nr:TRAP transporter small permease [Deltaproteobacteria bacterium]